MAGELRATVLTAVKGDALNKLKKDLDGIGGSLKGLGSMAASAVKGFAGFATAIGATKFITGAVEQAKLLEQTYRSLDIIFGPMTAKMEEFAKGAAKIGLSQTEAAKASIFIGNVLQQYGVSTEDAADKTQRLVTLASDLAFVTGYDVQEALLAMTALFRGEYDPIEKFGVAMKQNEIESVKAARGLEKLTGQAELNADVLIREELLLQRTAKAQGAFANNTDTLAASSEVLRATFENLQATVGQELSPVITQFFSDLIPIIEEAGPDLVKVFETLAEIIKEIAQIFIDAFDPTSQLGESIAELNIQFQSLARTISGENFNPIIATFQALYYVIDLFARALHDILLLAENLIIEFEAMGRVATAIFNQDWEAVSKGWRVLATEAKAARDEANRGKLAFEQLFYTISRGPTDVGDTTEIWDVTNKGAVQAGKKDGQDYGDQFKGAAKNPIKDFWSGLQDEVAKQSARMKLSAMGASEGLVDAILGGGADWQKVFNSILKGGLKALEKAQALFNKTGAGIKDIEAQAKKLLDVEIQRAKQMAKAEPGMESYWEAYINYLEQGLDKQTALAKAQTDFDAAMAEQAAKLREQNAELRDEFNKNIKELFSGFDTTGVVENLGEFEGAAKSLKDELRQLVEEGLKKDGVGLFSKKEQKQLFAIIDEVGGTLEEIGQARDKLTNEIQSAQDSLMQQQEQRKSLLESIADSIMGNVNIAQIGGKATTIIKSLQRTLKQTAEFSAQLNQLRGLGLSEQLVQQIIGSGADIGGQTAKALIQGGPEAIAEINNLYSAIGEVAQGIGEDAASSMFDAGIDTTTALIDGLLSQQEQLAQVAEQLANVFETAFTTNLRKKGALAEFWKNIGIALGGFGEVATAPSSAAAMAAGSSRNQAVTYNISINPGLVTDPAGLGREVVTAIQRFESTNGRVFARA